MRTRPVTEAQHKVGAEAEMQAASSDDVTSSLLRQVEGTGLEQVGCPRIAALLHDIELLRLLSLLSSE